jgi:hypothetical protein
VNNQFKDMNKRIGEVSARTEATMKKVEERMAEVGKVKGAVVKMVKLEQMEKRLEDHGCARKWEREIRRLNLVLHKVGVPSQRIWDGRKVESHDKKSCVTIFKAAKITTSEDIQVLQQDWGEKGTSLKSEDVKRNLLEKASDLQKTNYKDVIIGPDMALRQSQEEKRMREEVDRRNKEELS